jgi:4-hydroxy-3-methylbut-2-enyl diphosphate reductase
MGAQAHLIDSADDIDPAWLDNKKIGITAGASAPEILVKQVIECLQQLGATAPVEAAGIEESITFSLPRELRLIEV